MYVCLCRVLLLHGYSKFSLTILEYCEVAQLLSKDKYYIDILQPEYNIIQDPTVPPMLGRTHSDKSREQITTSLKKY